MSTVLRRLSRAVLPSSRQHLRKSFTSAVSVPEQQEKAVAKKPPKLFDADLIQAHWLSELLAMVPKFVHYAEITDAEMAIHTQKEYIIPLMRFLKYHTHAKFTMMMDMTAIDWIGQEERFELVYIMNSMYMWNVMRIHFRCTEMDHIESATRIHPVADYCEREVYDLFGIFFKNHPDLRRIMCDYGFQGHPLRKDFPVTGYVEMRYDDNLQRIIYEPIEITQEMRGFDYMNPWYTDHGSVHRTKLPDHNPYYDE